MARDDREGSCPRWHKMATTESQRRPAYLAAVSTNSSAPRLSCVPGEGATINDSSGSGHNMHLDSFIISALLLLAVTSVAVALFRHLGLGSVLACWSPAWWSARTSWGPMSRNMSTTFASSRSWGYCCCCS